MSTYPLNFTYPVFQKQIIVILVSIFSADTVPLDGGGERWGHSKLVERKKIHKQQPQENHKTKMAVQETASQLSMALKVQEYPTLKVNNHCNWQISFLYLSLYYLSTTIASWQFNNDV